MRPNKILRKRKEGKKSVSLPTIKQNTITAHKGDFLHALVSDRFFNRVIKLHAKAG